MPRPVKIPSGPPIRDTVSARISPAQNVPFWCSIGHCSYDKIADHSGRVGARRQRPTGVWAVPARVVCAVNPAALRRYCRGQCWLGVRRVARSTGRW
jgi:hypothetical protein